VAKAGVVEKFKQHSEDYLREFVYGGMDGAVTTFAVVTGAAGANLGVRVILILGFANVLADGFSMAVGSYLSEKSDQDLAIHKGERKAEDFESPVGAAIATFIAFVLVGFIPLAVYTLDFVLGLELDTDSALQYSIALTLFAFGLIGLLRAKVTKISKSKAIRESLGLGLAAAIISYAAGNVLEKIIT
jgi:VIT1/CCC1 family predicted Fe2+/Mn2+ transporter